MKIIRNYLAGIVLTGLSLFGCASTPRNWTEVKRLDTNEDGRIDRIETRHYEVWLDGESSYRRIICEIDSDADGDTDEQTVEEHFEYRSGR